MFVSPLFGEPVRGYVKLFGALAEYPCLEDLSSRSRTFKCLALDMPARVVADLTRLEAQKGAKNSETSESMKIFTRPAHECALRRKLGRRVACCS